MLTDLWPLVFMLGLFGVLYLIRLVLSFLGVKPTMGRPPGTPFCPPARDHIRDAVGSREHSEFLGIVPLLNAESVLETRSSQNLRPVCAPNGRSHRLANMADPVLRISH